MKAWVLNDIGDISLKEKEMPVFSDEEALIRVEAAGICGSDIPRIFETGAHVMPLVPGHEFSGVVTDIGRSVDKSLLNKKVGIYPLLPCGKCSCCTDGHPEMCRSYGYLGSRCDGGFAEYVKVPAKNLMLLPDNVSFEQAAMLEPLAVAVHAVRQAFGSQYVPAGTEKVTVCGTGTIGLLTVMVLKGMGFKDIVVIGNRESRRQKVTLAGISADKYYDFNSCSEGAMPDSVKDADVFFECVGKNECVNFGIKCLKPGGTMVTVGNPYSDMHFEKNAWWKILRDQLKVVGTWNSTFRFAGNDKAADDWEYAVEQISLGNIQPEKLITHRLKFEDLNVGLEMMRDKSEDYIKVMAETKSDECEKDKVLTEPVMETKENSLRDYIRLVSE